MTENKKKTHIVRARFNSSEYKKFINAKEKLDYKSDSEFIRQCCLDFIKNIEITTKIINDYENSIDIKKILKIKKKKRKN